MGNLQTFQPAEYSQLVTGIIFYALLLIAAAFSISTIYVLVRHGKSRTLAFGVAIIYSIIFLSITGQAIYYLNQIK